MTGRRPNTSDKVAVVGWKTVEQTRKDVPLQKASIAVPFRAVAMSCTY